MRWKGWLVMAGVTLVCVGGSPAVPTGAEVVALKDAVEPAGSGQINWTSGWVQATGLGAPPPNVGAGQARAMAQRAAFSVALRNLLEIVKGVRVDSETLVENYIVKNDVIKSQVNGFVRGAQVEKTDVQPDGSVEVTVKVPLWGADSLISPFMNEKGFHSQDLPPESSTDNGYTGLVIDARGLGVKPAFFPGILDEKGAVLYGPETVDRASAEKNGMVQYHALPKGATLSSVFGEQAYVIRPVQVTMAPREGRRPLKIKATDKAGALKANIMISSEDAKKIREDAQMGVALKRSKVVVVTDPLIGGMEGRAPMPDGVLVAVGTDAQH
ncbi:MAG: hypothetical protein HY581_03845 [Nitrospirae bacterium]|nr:hypothetical protein [Nitrospirota bacterium]